MGFPSGYDGGISIIQGLTRICLTLSRVGQFTASLKLGLRPSVAMKKCIYYYYYHHHHHISNNAVRVIPSLRLPICIANAGVVYLADLHR